MCIRDRRGDVEVGEGVEEAHDVFGRGGGPLQVVEGVPVAAIGVREELAGENLPVGRVVATPRDPAHGEVQRSLLALLGSGGARQPTATVGADQHEVCLLYTSRCV